MFLVCSFFILQGEKNIHRMYANNGFLPFVCRLCVVFSPFRAKKRHTKTEVPCCRRLKLLRASVLIQKEKIRRGEPNGSRNRRRIDRLRRDRAAARAVLP